MLKLECIMYHTRMSYMYNQCVAVRMFVFFYLIIFLLVATFHTFGRRRSAKSEGSTLKDGYSEVGP